MSICGALLHCDEVVPLSAYEEGGGGEEAIDLILRGAGRSRRYERAISPFNTTYEAFRLRPFVHTAPSDFPAPHIIT